MARSVDRVTTRQALHLQHEERRTDLHVTECMDEDGHYKTSSIRNEVAYNANITVHNAANMVVNGNMHVVVNKDTRGKRRSKKRRKDLTTSTEKVTREIILEIKGAIGSDWRDLGRHLGFEDGELEQLEHDCSTDSCELNYQLLLRAQRKDPEGFTKAKLAAIFDRMKRGDLADLLAE